MTACLRFFSFLSILLFFFKVQAQNSTIYLGVRGGFNGNTAILDHQIANLSIDEDFTNGKHFGILGKYFFSNKNPIIKSGIRLELNFIERGYAQQFILLGLPPYKASFNYLELPILSEFYFGKVNKYFINGGVFFGRLLSFNQENIIESDDVDNFPFIEERDNYWSYGYRLGAGISRDFPFGTIVVDGIFNFTLSNLLDFQTFDTFIPDTSNLFEFGISIGYMHRF